MLNDKNDEENNGIKAMTFKYLTVGESFCGKTSLIYQYVEHKFFDKLYPTVGFDFKKKIVKKENKTISQIIWDTAGQEKYHGLVTQYYKNADAIILIFDISDLQSFEKCDQWIKEIDEIQCNNPIYVLVGNKIDLNNIRKVPTETAKHFAEGLKINYFEASAKTGEGIDEIFDYLNSELIKKRFRYIKEDYHLITKTNKKNKKNNKCCYN